MSSKKQFHVNAGYHRMNYLYQLMHACSSRSINGNEGLVSNYGKLLAGVGKKTLSRIEPAVKRTICKGCNILLIPGETARVRVKKKPAGRVVWTCLSCANIKRFKLKPGYQMWMDKQEAIVTVVKDDGEPVSDNKGSLEEKQESGVKDRVESVNERKENLEET